MDTFAEVLGWGLLLIIAIALALFLVPAIELWIWGLVIVPVFGAPVLTFWQMFWLNIFTGLLFGRTVKVEGKK